MVGWMERLRRAELGPERGGLDFGFSRVCNPSRHTGLVFSLGYFPSTLPYIPRSEVPPVRDVVAVW